MILLHPAVRVGTLDKVALAEIPFSRESEEARTWKLTSAPALLLVDNTGDAPRLIKKITSGSPASLRRAIEAAAKNLSPP